VGRRTKLPAARAKAAARPPSLTEMLDRSAGQLSRMLDLIERATAKGAATPALVRESASAARALVALSGEQRAREKQAAAARDGMTPTAVQEWFRSLPASERAGLLAELAELASGRSGLA
jgi:hypothetical protein